MTMGPDTIMTMTTTMCMTTKVDTAVAEPGAASARLALLRLLQLASPALPIGGFAYSQGLEPAVTLGLVTDEASAARWVLGLLAGPLTTLDLAVFGRIHRAFGAGDAGDAWRWNDFLMASRSTAELQAEDRHLGAALGRVLVTLGIADVDLDAGPAKSAAPTFVSMFALATARWKIDLRPALEAFAFAWAQAQTSAAVRLVPLGQSAGVRILADVARAIPPLVDRALAIDDDDIGGGGAAPGGAVVRCTKCSIPGFFVPDGKESAS